MLYQSLTHALMNIIYINFFLKQDKSNGIKHKINCNYNANYSTTKLQAQLQ